MTTYTPGGGGSRSSGLFTTMVTRGVGREPDHHSSKQQQQLGRCSKPSPAAAATAAPPVMYVPSFPPPLPPARPLPAEAVRGIPRAANERPRPRSGSVFQKTSARAKNGNRSFLFRVRNLNLPEKDALRPDARGEREGHPGLVAGLSLRERSVVALEHPVKTKGKKKNSYGPADRGLRTRDKKKEQVL